MGDEGSTVGTTARVTVDLGEALAVRLGVPLELVVHNSSGEIIESADQNTWDMAFTPVDEERKRRVAFGPNYFLGESTYLVPAGSPITTLVDVDQSGVRVVGVENTATLRSARRVLKNAAVIGVSSLDEALRVLAAGEAQAIALGRESLQSLSPQLPGSQILEGAFHAAGTAIAVPKGKPLARAYVAAFIEAAKADGTVRRAFDRNGMEAAAVAPPGALS